MKSFRLRSQTQAMLFGGALVATALLAVGAVHQVDKTAERVLLDPHPLLVVRILQGAPYTVPAQQMLTIKALGQAGGIGAGGDQILLRINGADVLVGQTDPNPVQLTMGVVAGPGDVVTVETVFNNPPTLAVALGYLTNL